MPPLLWPPHEDDAVFQRLAPAEQTWAHRVWTLLARYRARVAQPPSSSEAETLADVLQALRKLDLQGAIPASRQDLVDSLRALRIRRYPHESLLDDIWALRRHITAYDATYVALARQLDATLVTNNEADFAGYPGLRVDNWVGRA